MQFIIVLNCLDSVYNTGAKGASSGVQCQRKENVLGCTQLTRKVRCGSDLRRFDQQWYQHYRQCNHCMSAALSHLLVWGLLNRLFHVFIRWLVRVGF